MIKVTQTQLLLLRQNFSKFMSCFVFFITDTIYAVGFNHEFFLKLVLVPFKVIHMFNHWSLILSSFLSHYRVLEAAIKQLIHHCTGIGSKRLTETDFLEMKKGKKGSNDEW